jgi:Fur family ferric uptake transcriptional regulator
MVIQNENGYNLEVTTSIPSPQRMTRQRRAVEAALERSPGFCSAQALHASLRDEGERVGLATVYSQLRQMAELGLVDVVRSDAGEALYRRCGAHEHHHHLRCRSCGRVEELKAPVVEAWAKEVGASSGYQDLVHSLEVTGICPACAGG